MTPEQLEALKVWVEALIDDKIQTAFGRDGMHERMCLLVAERELTKNWLE